jgi:cobalt-zinc-cadmium efflux system membrane fusion protein
MKRIATILTVVMLAAQGAFAAEIRLTGDEADNLGVRSAAPLPAEQVPAIEATATVVIPPANDLFVSAPLPGLLLRLELAAGERVTAGQVLAEIKSPAFLGLQREFLDALTESLLAQRAYERDRQMFDEGIVSERRLQETESRATTTAAALREHRQMLQIAGLSANEIRALEQEQLLSNVLCLRAPVDGVVLERLAVTGQPVDEMSPVYHIADLSTLWLDISVPREYFEAIRPGMRVRVEESASSHPAVVTTVGSAVDPATQSIHVRAVIDRPDHGLRPGQFVAADLVEDPIDASLAGVWSVPVAAVVRSGETFFVFVKTRDGFAAREVRVAGLAGGRQYLRAEFAAGEQVAVAGIAALKAIWKAQSETDS